MKFSEKEKYDLFKAWVAISLAFGIIIAKRLDISIFSAEFTPLLLVSALSVGIGFLLHEIGHKYVAQKYNFWAEFRSSDRMLMFAILLALFTPIIFAAPGAVMINGYYMTKEKNGKISAAGPLVNLVLAILFIVLILAGINNLLTGYGAFINSLIALFNLIPFGNLDGKKILTWNKPVYATMVTLGIILFFVSSTLANI
ncbi:peptidase M50 [Candidatus Woesearchaeota archaeon]|jgi:Zn-dependent protease|nr:peptidase M50 [Candidatus Woesearchaeota archaeon]MBT4321606.1 peptidase M50 [Candidatus Woesearchaeota archaeon]MBT4631083.1 peptidase M50 [Candidatus Woesearchaeota archaeon]